MTVYHTPCGLMSAPEPSPAEFETWDEFQAAWQAWNAVWSETARLHAGCSADMCMA